MEQPKTLTYQKATGAIRFKMVNDYMFRYILQKNQKVLRGLICALLHLKPSDIKKIEIKNPINLTDDITGKEFIMDIHIILNDDTFLNLEMQVVNTGDWPERSLGYLCRGYDNLRKGQKYEETMPVIHIGFVDFTPFPEVPEFYSKYLLINVKNNHVYTDKFVMRVVNLKRVDLATDEDKAFQIDHWARLFKAETWEDIKMLAKDDEFLQEAAESLYVANSDEVVRQHCLAREDAERRERTQQKRLEEAEEAVRQHRLAREDAERRERIQQRKLEDAERRIAEEEAKRAEAEAKRAEAEGKRIEDIINLCREFGQSEDDIKQRLVKELNLSVEAALAYMNTDR